MGKFPSQGTDRYWFHNIEFPTLKWLHYLKSCGLISLAYRDQDLNSDPGRKKMLQYKIGDRIFIYANGIGVVGFIVIAGEYLFMKDEKKHRHRIPVKWLWCVDKLEDAIPPCELKKLASHGSYFPRHAVQFIKDPIFAHKIIEFIHARRV